VERRDPRLLVEVQAMRVCAVLSKAGVEMDRVEAEALRLVDQRISWPA
jgi:hypothetical protein